MKIIRRMEWPYIDKFGSLEEVSEYCQLLYQTLTEESALRAIELDVPYTDGYNVFIGHEAGQSNTISLDDTEGLYNVFLGHQAGYSNTTGIKNTAINYQSLYSNTTGYDNIAIGSQSLYSNNTGYENIAIGVGSLYSNTSGRKNIAIGENALYAHTTSAGANVAVGYSSGEDCTGSSNIFIGANAGQEATTGDENVCVGTGAGQGSDGNSTYSDNVLIGTDAGASLTTGSGNIFIGYQCAFTRETTGANKLYIANSSTATPLIGGVFPNTSLTFTSTNSSFTGNLGVGTASPGGKLDVAGGILFSANQIINGPSIFTTSNILYLAGGTTGTYINNQANSDNLVTISNAGAMTVLGCVADGSCEIMKNEDALAIIDDMLKTGSGKKDEYNHERMDMKKIHQKYPFMIREQKIKEKNEEEKVKYFDKLGAKSDLLYVAVGQLIERIEALEAE